MREEKENLQNAKISAAGEDFCLQGPLMRKVRVPIDKTGFRPVFREFWM